MRRSRPISLACVLAAVVALVAPVAAATGVAAADPPAPSPFACAAPAAGGPTPAKIADFVGKWLPRVTDRAGAWNFGQPSPPIPELKTFQAFVDQKGFPARTTPPVLLPPELADRAVREWPAQILGEGFHHPVFTESYPPGTYPGVPAAVAACLISNLDIALRADPAGGAAYSAANPDPDKGKGILYGLILDRSWRLRFEPTSAPTIATATQALPDMGQVLDLLKAPDSVDSLLAALPRVTLPTELVPPLGTPLDLDALVNQLKLPLVKPLALPNLAELVPQIPLAFPNINLPIGGLLLGVSRIIDSLTYRVCYESPKVLVPVCSPDIPLNLPWPVDLDGNGLPDALAQLQLPALAGNPLASDVSAAFNLTRLPLVSSGNLPGNVYAIFEAPTNDVRLSVGLGSQADSTIADKATATFTIKKVLKAIQGPLTVDATVVHRNPGPNNFVTFGATDLKREANPLAAPTERDALAAGITFFPAPKQTGLLLPKPSERVDVHAVLTSDLNRDGQGGDSQTDVKLTMPTARPVNIFATTRSPSAFDAADPKPAKCCPEQVVFGSFRNFPSKTQVVLTNDAPNRKTDVVYHASSKIDTAFVNAYDYPVGGDPATHTLYPSADEAKTYTQRTLTALAVPKDVHVAITAPDKSATKTTFVHYDASDKIGQLQFEQRHVRRDTATGNADLVDQTTGTVNSIPTRIDATISDRIATIPGLPLPPATERTESVTDVTYDADGPTGTIEAEVRGEGLDGDTPKGAHIQADTLPPFVTAHIVKRTPTNLGDAGDLDAKVEARACAQAACAPASFGTARVEYRSNAAEYLTDAAIGGLLKGDGAPMAATDQFVAVRTAALAGSAKKAATQATARVVGLAGGRAQLNEHVKGVSDFVVDIDKTVTTNRLWIGAQTDDLVVRSVIDSIPQHLHVERTVAPYATGDANDARAYSNQHVGFESCSTPGPGCAGARIGHAKVSVVGLKVDGTPFSSDERVEADIDSLASRLGIDISGAVAPAAPGQPPLAGTPPTNTKVTYDANQSVPRVHVDLLKRVTGFNPSLVTASATATDVPSHFDVGLGGNGEVDFVSPTPISTVDAVVSNGTAPVPRGPGAHAWANVLDGVNDDGTTRSGRSLQASVLLHGLMQFRLRPKGGDVDLGTPGPAGIVTCAAGSTCAVLRTATTANLNPNFSARADVGFPGTALRANLTLGDLPDLLVFTKKGDGTLAVDTTKSAKPAPPVFLDLASATTVKAARTVVTDGAPSPAPIDGVKISDQSTTDVDPATHVQARLGILPRLIQISPKHLIEKFEPVVGPNEALVLKGFAGSEGPGVAGPHTFRAVVDLDDCKKGTSADNCAPERLYSDVSMGGIPATGMDLTLRPIKAIKGFRQSGALLNATVARTLHLILGIEASHEVAPLSVQLHSGTDINAVDAAGDPDTETVVVAKADRLPAHTSVEVNLDGKVLFKGSFRNAGNGDDTPQGLSINYSDVNARHGGGFKDVEARNPLVDVALKQVPTTFEFRVEPQPAAESDSVGITNCVQDPETGAYGAEKKQPLPTITYTATGVNADAMDITGGADPRGALLRLSALSALTPQEAAAGKFVSPDVVFKIDDLGRSFGFVNNRTKDDNKFDLSSTPPTGSIQVYVDNFKTNLFNLSTECIGKLFDIGVVSAKLYGGFAVDLSTNVALRIDGKIGQPAETVRLDPGLNTGVHGDGVESVALTLGGPAGQPQLVLRSPGFGVRVHYDLGITDGDFSVPFLPAFSRNVGFTPKFHVYDHTQTGDFAVIYTPIFCGLTSDFDVKDFVGIITARPKRVDVSDGGFTMHGDGAGHLVGSATVDVFDLFGLPSGIGKPISLDFVDAMTQLFLAKESPKGIKGVTVACRA